MLFKKIDYQISHDPEIAGKRFEYQVQNLFGDSGKNPDFVMGNL